MKTGIKVVVAQPGTMMPSGALIWDGSLRGVPSSGMIVSGRELHLPGAPEKPGALVYQMILVKLAMCLTSKRVQRSIQMD